MHAYRILQYTRCLALSRLTGSLLNRIANRDTVVGAHIIVDNTIIMNGNPEMKMGRVQQVLSMIKRKADSQPSTNKKKFKDDPDAYKIDLESETYFKLSPEMLDCIKGTFKFIMKKDREGFLNLLFNLPEQTRDKQRIRYYWKSFLLYYLKKKRESLITPYVYDGSLINQLNDNCLAKIFTYLPVSERLNVGEVCQQWKKVLQHAWFDVKKLDFSFMEFLKTDNFHELLSKLKYMHDLITHSGRFLKELDVTCFPSSRILSTIEDYCPNLVKLQLRFFTTHLEDFENIFKFMPDLKSLEVTWNNNTSMPVTFIASLNQLTDTLEELELINRYFYSDNENEQEYNNLPDSWISTFRQFKSLQNLTLQGYDLDDEMIEAISQREGLIKLSLYQPSDNSIYPISNLKNLEHLDIACITINNSFLVNLSDNSRNLKYLEINGTNISDVGIISLTKLKKLEVFKMLLDDDDNTEYITDESIAKFKSIKKLDVSYCTNVTNYSVTKILNNCPDVEELNLRFTGITGGIIEQAARLTNNRKNNVVLEVTVSLEDIPKDLSEKSEYTSPWLKVVNTYYD